MLSKTQGIVLNKVKFGDSGFVLKVYTANFGLQSFLIQGIRKKNAKLKANLFQPLSLLDLVIYRKENSTLHRIKELKSNFPFTSIPYDIVKSSLALFITEVLINTIKEEEKNPALFDFLIHGIKILDLHQSNIANFHLLFLSKLSRHLGFYPTGDFEKGNNYFDLQEGSFVAQQPIHPHFLDEEYAQIFNTILGINFEALNSINITKEQRKYLLEQLVNYYQFHLSETKKIQSHKVLEEVMC